MENFEYVIEIVTNPDAGVTLANQMKWLRAAGLVNKVDFRHCGTKTKVYYDVESTLPKFVNTQKIQFNRFRFREESNAILFKLAWS